MFRRGFEGLGWRVGSGLLALATTAIPPASAAESPSLPATPPPLSTQQRAQPAGTGPPAAQQAQINQPVKRTEDEQLLLEIRLNDIVLSDAMPAFVNGGSIMLPLREFATALEFPINVNAAAGQAGGWFLRENRLFSLDRFTAEAVIEGRVSSFDPTFVDVFGNDLYVDIRLLAKWFPIDITFDLSMLTAFLKSREPLPVEQRLEREDARKRSLGGRAEDKQFKRFDFPRPLLSPPTIDVNMEASFDRKEGSGDSNSGYSLLATGDLLKTNAYLYLGGTNQDQVDQARFRIDRKDPDGNVFGGLGVTEFSAGDIVGPDMTLVSRSPLGRGATLSTMPLNAPREFDRTTINGELPLGWEVELYRNEVLVDFKTSRADGRYEFANVPLLFGVNILKLVFYGPQGQRREEIKQFRVGPDQLKPGQIGLLVSAQQQNQNLLMQSENTADDLRRGEDRTLAEVQVGVSQNMSLIATTTSLPLVTGERETYNAMSSLFSIGDLFGRADFVDQADGGWASKLSAQQSVFGVSVIGEHSILRDFQSEQFDNIDDPLKSQSKVRLDGRIPVPVINQLPINITGTHDRHESSDTESTLSNRVSAALGRASVTTASNIRRTETAGDTAITSDGSLLIGGRIDNVRLRGSIAYGMRPDWSVNTVAMTGEWDLTREFAARLGATHDLTETGRTTYTFGVNWLARYAAFGLNFDFTDTDDFGFRLTTSFSGVANPRTGAIGLQRESMAERGGMAARVFQDLNANGIHDDDEPVMPEVRFNVDGGNTRNRTDEGGYLLITGLEPYSYVNVSVDPASLPDPFLVPAPEGISFVPRPGSIEKFDFGIVTTGEIDGTVYRRGTTEINPVSGAIVQLLDAEGSVIREQRSAYDGFYLFDFVPPGAYTIRVDPVQLESLNLISSEDHRPEVGGEGTIINSMDITLMPVGTDQPGHDRPPEPFAEPPQAPTAPAPQAVPPPPVYMTPLGEQAEAPVAQPDPAAGPDVAIRIEEAGDLSRIYFTWPDEVGYRLDRMAGILMLTFESGGRIDLESWRAHPPRQVKDVGSRLSRDKLIFTMSIDESATVRDRRHEKSVVIEIAPPGRPIATTPGSGADDAADAGSGPKPVPDTNSAEGRADADRQRRPTTLGAAFGREFGAILLGGPSIRR